MEQFREIQADPTKQHFYISIVGAASPEGTVALNGRLSRKRAAKILNYLREKVPGMTDSVHVETPGVDWRGLESAVSESDMPHRDEVLYIIRNTPEVTSHNGVNEESRKQQFIHMNGGSDWSYNTITFSPTCVPARCAST